MFSMTLPSKTVKNHRYKSNLIVVKNDFSSSDFPNGGLLDAPLGHNPSFTWHHPRFTSFGKKGHEMEAW